LTYWNTRKKVQDPSILPQGAYPNQSAALTEQQKGRKTPPNDNEFKLIIQVSLSLNFLEFKEFMEFKELQDNSFVPCFPQNRRTQSKDKCLETPCNSLQLLVYLTCES